MTCLRFIKEQNSSSKKTIVALPTKDPQRNKQLQLKGCTVGPTAKQPKLIIN